MYFWLSIRRNSLKHSCANAKIACVIILLNLEIKLWKTVLASKSNGHAAEVESRVSCPSGGWALVIKVEVLKEKRQRPRFHFSFVTNIAISVHRPPVSSPTFPTLLANIKVLHFTLLSYRTLRTCWWYWKNEDKREKAKDSGVCVRDSCEKEYEGYWKVQIFIMWQESRWRETWHEE